MARRVICIARSLYATGEEIGRLVARDLGFRYADEEIIIKAAERAGVSPSDVAQLENPPSLIARILESMARTPVDPEGLSRYACFSIDTSPAFESLIAQVIRETANEGNVVIVAHGASIPLAGTAGLLRVLVTASPDVRAQRLMRNTDLDQRHAKRAIRESDRKRREYLQRFYGVGRELPTHYDLVVNTDVLTPAHAARLIVTAAK